jgi:hypothetical protein
LFIKGSGFVLYNSSWFHGVIMLVMFNIRMYCWLVSITGNDSEVQAQDVASLDFVSLPCLAGVVSYKASHATATILWCIALLIWVLIIPDSFTRVICLVVAETSSNVARRNWARNDRWNLPVSICIIPRGIF